MRFRNWDANGERLLVALGGNAIKQSAEKGTSEEQFKNCDRTAKHLTLVVRTLKKADRLVITHGNGPQAGNLLVQQGAGMNKVPPQTMDIVGAMTQGQIGYMLQQTMENYLRDLRIDVPVLAVVNQVLVDKDDSEFQGDRASKPVGNFLTEDEVRANRMEHPDHIFKKVKPTGDRSWRRTVASPRPVRNIESDVIERLVNAGIIIIASGGGGIPVVLDDQNHYRGVEAVIDKDLAGEKLAEAVGATLFLVLTDVEKVKLNYGQPNEREIDRMSVSEAKKYLDEGHFLAGSMGPKVEACVKFLEWGGRMAVITSLEKVVDALDGKAGTRILRDYSEKPAYELLPLPEA